MKNEFESAICERKIIYEFSTLKDKFIEIAQEKGIDARKKLNNKRIKTILKHAWSEIRFISR